MVRRHPCILLAVLALALVAIPGTASASTAARPSACASSAAHVAVNPATVVEARVATLCLLNRERTSRGLRPLRLNEKLSNVAAAHSRDMVTKKYFAHDSLNGTSPFARILAAHYAPRNSTWWLGENIGWGSDALGQPIELVRAWMHSPDHRANILSADYREIGIGIAPGVPIHEDVTGATYTTDFGRHT